MLTNDQKKDILHSYRHAVRALREAEEEYRQLELSVLLPRSPTLGDTHGGSGISDQSGYVARLRDIADEEIRPKADEAIRIRNRIVKAIDALPTEQERSVMRVRYLHFGQTQSEERNHLPGTRLLSWDEVAERCYYSRAHVTRIHGAALAHIKLD